jgi:hypothetical protein
MIAARHGLDPQEVWNLSENRTLRESRPNPEVLAPGDVVHLPEPQQPRNPITSGGTHRLRARVPGVRVRFLLGTSESPLRDEPYVAEGITTEPIRGTTDGDGAVTLTIPVHVRTFDVTLTRRNATFAVRVGHLDPAEETSGVETRLQQLGYLVPTMSDLFGHPAADDIVALRRSELLQESLAAFQRDQGIDPSSGLDEATRAALRRAFGA